MTDNGGALLVIGGDGMIGSALVAEAALRGLPCHWTSRRPASPAARFLDLGVTDEDFLIPPDVTAAVFVAAQARLAACEETPEAAALVNVTGVSRLAQRLAKAGVRPILLSTNLVHGGQAANVAETSLPAPRTEYGRQKAAAEQAVLGLGGTVLRMTKVLAPANALIAGWGNDMRAGQVIHPFHDMVMAPVTLPLAVTAILAVAGAAAQGGAYQISASRDVTYAEAAGHLARRLGVAEALIAPRSCRDIGLTEPFAPAHTALSTARMAEEFGFSAPDPLAVLDEVIAPFPQDQATNVTNLPSASPT